MQSAGASVRLFGVIAKFWIGFWNDYPDHTTQGYSFEELKEMLVDLRQIILSGDLGEVPRRSVGTLQFA